jgi:hypothetical protein
MYAKLPKLSLQDSLSDNSVLIVSTPAVLSGSLSSPLDPMSIDIDLHDVPINDDGDILSTNIKSESMEEVFIKSINFLILFKIF